MSVNFILPKLALGIYSALFYSQSFSQGYNKDYNDKFFKVQSFCLARISPEDGKVKNNPYLYDVAKEVCVCISDRTVLENLLVDSTPAKEHRFVQVYMYCKDATFNKREFEALASYNRALIARNLPPVSRFPWHYWFD